MRDALAVVGALAIGMWLATLAYIVVKVATDYDRTEALPNALPRKPSVPVQASHLVRLTPADLDRLDAQLSAITCCTDHLTAVCAWSPCCTHCPDNPAPA
jgi:hypothetical protein